jgi:hypothetical protein
MSIPGRRSLDEHWRRTSPKDRPDRLTYAQGKINDFIRSKAPRVIPGDEVQRAKDVADTGAKLAALDQGSRGGTPPPKPAGKNDDINARLRAAHKGEPYEEPGEADRSTAP